MLDAVFKDIIEFFREIYKDLECKVKRLDKFTTVLTFPEETIIINLDLITDLLSLSKLNESVLEVKISSNARLLVKEEVKASGPIMDRLCENMRFNVTSLLEGYFNGHLKDSHVESTA